jgi:hypothetical protein
LLKNLQHIFDFDRSYLEDKKGRQFPFELMTLR